MAIPKGSLTQLLTPKDSSLNKEEKPLDSVYIPYVKVVSEKLKCIGIRYSIGSSLKLNTH
jgi:hypothetical protein